MSEFSVGDKVRVTGSCLCTPTPPGDGRAFHDTRDCFHKPNIVGRVFQGPSVDAESVWVINRYGFARRFYSASLVWME